MVQASDDIDFHNDNENQDVLQALALLDEVNSSVQHVIQLVDSMIAKVRNGELSTSQGLSFLEMKYQMLLSYIINQTYVILRKCSGEKIEGDPSIDRLIEIRTVLEKIRPVDHKLRYQINKLVKNAVTGSSRENDPSSFRANPDNLVSKLNEGSESSSDEETENMEKIKKPGVYVPPKLAPVHYSGDETAKERQMKQTERVRKQQLSSSVIQDLREEYTDTPIEVAHSSRAQQFVSRQEKERTDYEENYLTRLPVTKAEKRKSNRVSKIGNLGDEITNFGIGSHDSSKKSKRKRKSGKSKGNKKRKFH